MHSDGLFAYETTNDREGMRQPDCRETNKFILLPGNSSFISSATEEMTKGSNIKGHDNKVNQMRELISNCLIS